VSINLLLVGVNYRQNTVYSPWIIAVKYQPGCVPFDRSALGEEPRATEIGLTPPRMRAGGLVSITLLVGGVLTDNRVTQLAGISDIQPGAAYRQRAW